MGTLAAVTAPTVSAEVDGRIVRLAAEADIRSLQAQIDNERRRVARFESLKEKDYLAQTQLDDSRAQLEMLQAQTAVACARLAIIADKVARTTVRAPVAGTVEQRRVSVGDFVRRGDPMFDLTADDDLQAFLPFPETVSQALHPGLEVTLASPIAPGTAVTARVAELRLVVGRGSRAVTAIVPLRNPGPWRDQATVQAEVLVERRPHAVVVPAGAVVRRPAGEVVYLLEQGRAVQRRVTLGVRVADAVEVLEGLAGGEAIAVEGASYLTDGAAVRVAGVPP
jgi:RND family efflux transporter MFP subunit